MDRIPERLSDESRERWRKRRKGRRASFLAGPIPLVWLAQASKLRGSALAVGLAVWFKTRCEDGSKAVPVCPSLLERLGVSAQSGYRGLKALEAAGLVYVVRHRGRCPLVVIRKGKA